MRCEGQHALDRFRPVVAEADLVIARDRPARHDWPSQPPRTGRRSRSSARRTGIERASTRCFAAFGRDDAAARVAIDSMVVRCYFDAFNERNFATCMVTHAAQWQGRFRSGDHTTLATREVNLARLRSLVAALPGVQLRVVDLHADGGLVVVRFDVVAHAEVRSRHGVSWGSEARGFAVFRLARGRIVDEYVVHPLLGRHAQMFTRTVDGGLELA